MPGGSHRNGPSTDVLAPETAVFAAVAAGRSDQPAWDARPSSSTSVKNAFAYG
jgi:hypothetical protein